MANSNQTRFSTILTDMIPDHLHEEVSAEGGDELVVYVKPIVLALVALSLTIVLASLAANLYYFYVGGIFPVRIVPGTMVDNVALLLSLDAEGSIPSLFSSFLLLVASCCFMMIALAREASGKECFRGHWTVLSLGFLVMSVDEAVGFHELVNAPMVELIKSGDRLGLFYYAWTVPAFAIVLGLGCGFSRFFLNLPGPSIKWKLTLAASLYLGGALVVEMIGGYLTEAHGQTNLAYILVHSAEESLEIAGVVVLIWTLLLYISEEHGILRVYFLKG